MMWNSLIITDSLSFVTNLSCLSPSQVIRVDVCRQCCTICQRISVLQGAQIPSSRRPQHCGSFVLYHACTAYLFPVQTFAFKSYTRTFGCTIFELCTWLACLSVLSSLVQIIRGMYICVFLFFGLEECVLLRWTTHKL